MSAATVAGLEQKKMEYFSSINSMARKIMEEREKVREQHGPSWDKMTPNERDDAIDNSLMEPQVRARYALHRVDRPEVVCYPKLLLNTGQKIVHFGDEDITWQDEHSAPFSWETKSQLEFSLSSGPADQNQASSQSESKSTKVAPNPGSKVASGEALGVARRAEEESSFWKLSAERSRLEGGQADFHSLTPSQIKSLEKGEKPLPSYLRQETKEQEVSEPPQAPPPVRAPKQRAPKPPAPPPPVPIAITTTPAAAISITPSPAPQLSVSSSVAGWERAQSTLPSVSPALDDVFPSGAPGPKAPSPAPSPAPGPAPAESHRNLQDKEDANLATSPTFAQFNTSSNILKTGFDFLDNW